MQERLFTPRDKIAPGLYMRYWDAIVEKHNGKFLHSNKLKQYVEVRNGAILAALWTKTTGQKHFVSFPSNEPADVEIYTLEPIRYKGKDSFNLVKVPVQLTRCSLVDGESIYEQVVKKNKPALENTTLVVHASANDGDSIDLALVAGQIQAIDKIYPKEIAVIAPLLGADNNQTFGQALLSNTDSEQQVRTSKVNLSEKEYFFEHPPVMHSAKGTSRAVLEVGEFRLLLP